MKISKTLIDCLRRLLAGETVPASSLRKDIGEQLLSEGLLSVAAHGSRRTYRAVKVGALKMFLESRFEEFRHIAITSEWTEKETLTRSDLASLTGNSKLLKVRSCPGFPINSYEQITCLLNGHEFVVCPHEGSFLYVTDWRSFSIPEDVIVVGVENMENFRLIRRQRELFESQVGNRLLFVSRYPQSADLRDWLQSIPNRYVHFGDFDLAGIHIFLTEFHPYILSRASFLIPTDIEERLRIGSMERYNAQLSKFRHLHCELPALQTLIDLINKYHRCYDQEGYIK